MSFQMFTTTSQVDDDDREARRRSPIVLDSQELLDLAFSGRNTSLDESCSSNQQLIIPDTPDSSFIIPSVRKWTAGIIKS